MKLIRVDKCCDECPGDYTCEHATVCICGSEMKNHDDMWNGHSAVSMHDYHCEQIVDDEAQPRTL